MTDYGLPALFALFLWWTGTGVVLYLDGLPASTHRRSLLGATALLVVSLWGLALSSEMTTVGGAYIAFACALGAWGWVETAFLLGFTTGPRKVGCRAGCDGWAHFLHGVQAVLYHEFAIIAVGAAVLASTWNGSNPVGIWTFLVLWGMRQSAKINVFLGVRNLSEEFLPEHLRYLQSFLTRKPMNAFLPVSITVATALAAYLFLRAWSTAASDFEVAAYSLVASLLTLGVLEHWFMVLPMSTNSLWKLGLSTHQAAPCGEDDIAAREAGRDRYEALIGFEQLAVVTVDVERGAARNPADIGLRRR
jgi:putative photosynthetic complex assembly protein 2